MTELTEEIPTNKVFSHWLCNFHNSSSHYVQIRSRFIAVILSAETIYDLCIKYKPVHADNRSPIDFKLILVMMGLAEM